MFVRDALLFFFFFQAEDGIRDLVRSRGLGDVYKRQSMNRVPVISRWICLTSIPFAMVLGGFGWIPCIVSVSYTHLTLPTSDLV